METFRLGDTVKILKVSEIDAHFRKAYMIEGKVGTIIEIDNNEANDFAGEIMVEDFGWYFRSVQISALNLLTVCEDTLGWLETGMVDGVGFDETQVIESLKRAITEAKKVDTPPVGEGKESFLNQALEKSLFLEN